MTLEDELTLLRSIANYYQTPKSLAVQIGQLLSYVKAWSWALSNPPTTIKGPGYCINATDLLYGVINKARFSGVRYNNNECVQLFSCPMVLEKSAGFVIKRHNSLIESKDCLSGAVRCVAETLGYIDFPFNSYRVSKILELRNTLCSVIPRFNSVSVTLGNNSPIGEFSVGYNKIKDTLECVFRYEEDWDKAYRFSSTQTDFGDILAKILLMDTMSLEEVNTCFIPEETNPTCLPSVGDTSND